MKTFIKLSGIVTLLFFSLTAQTQVPKNLMNDFISEDWKAVKSSKLSIEDLQADALPDLIKLLENNEISKLTNTGSLIYPGAEKFFGHGQILDYDIDYISIRAGWLIEEISFNNFVFSAVHLPKEDLITSIKMTFPEYYNKSANRKKLEAASNDELRKISLKLSVDAAKTWWTEDEKSWTRLNALVQALRSNDEKRQVKALFYLRNGTSKCDGLTSEFYIDEISKEIVRLSMSNVQRISEHAKLILMDSNQDWLKMKE